jgi:FMN reductase
MTRRIVVISAGLSQPSSTRLLADRLSAATVAALHEPATVATVELREVAHDITNALLTGFAAPALQKIIDDLGTADAVIAVTPTFNASYSGLFKLFFDIVATDVLTETPVLIAATGGTERHSLVLDHALRPMFTYLHASVVPLGVYAASSDWGAGDAALGERITQAARQLAAATATSTKRPADDGIDNVVSFETLLAG